MSKNAPFCHINSLGHQDRNIRNRYTKEQNQSVDTQFHDVQSSPVSVRFFKQRRIPNEPTEHGPIAGLFSADDFLQLPSLFSF